MRETLELKQLPALDSLCIDRDHYYRQVLDGYYDFPREMKDKTVRRAKLYMPSHSVYNQPAVYLLIPDKKDPGEFLVESGWKQAADENHLFLIILEPENGTWKSLEDEIPYIDEVRRVAGNKPCFSMFPPRTYGAGYEKGAEILSAYAMKNPQNWSGLLLAGAKGLSIEKEKELQALESPEPGIFVSQVQMPVWIVEPSLGVWDAGHSGENETHDAKRLADYFRRSNHCTDVETKGACETVTAGGLESRMFLPVMGGSEDEDQCAPVILTEADWNQCLNADFCTAVYQRLWKGTCRYNGNRVGALRHDGDIYERGFKRFTERVPGGYCKDGSDYYCREWYVYLPESAEGKGAVPAVFLFHGAGGSGDEIGDRSGWARLAKEKGFLLVCPSASNENIVRFFRNVTSNHMFRSRWNTANPKPDYPSDMVFLDHLYPWIMEHYHVDRSRVYACGQSSGGMMTWACAAYRSDYFAAAAPVSAKDVNKMEEPLPFIKGSKVPIMASMGTEDKIFPDAFSTQEARDLIDYFADLYDLDKRWSDYTFMKGGKSCTWKEGLFANYVFKNNQGFPMLRMIEADTKTHAIWPSECRMIWEEWFSKFTKDPDTKTLYYEGQEVR